MMMKSTANAALTDVTMVHLVRILTFRYRHSREVCPRLRAKLLISLASLRAFTRRSADALAFPRSLNACAESPPKRPAA